MSMPTIEIDALFQGLTEPQREAVGHVDGPLLVLAGPGSGKTTVVTRRVAHLVAQGIPPWQILALTFTNKAAGEMRERIARLLPENLPGVRGLTVATFHSFCARLLRRYAEQAGLRDNYTIYDSGDQREAIKTALKAAGLDTKNWTPASVAAAISNAKNQLQSPVEFAAQTGDFYSRSIAKAYENYAKILKANNAVDFDDLLLITAKLIRNSREVREELQSRFQYLLIDEYQDTNHAQFVIAHSLASASRNICVVGDPDQSIYGWRGADIRNIMEFEEHYANAQVIALGQNFRSTGHIVETADQLIRHNTQRKDKKLHTELGDGEKPQVVTCRDEHHEAKLIVDEFKRRRDDDGVAWKDMAVLYRVNSLSRVLEEAFRDAQIPYIIARGTAFYDRKEIKDALAYLRVVANPNDEVSLKRIINTPTRGIGNTSLDRVEIFAIRHQLGLFDALRQVEQVPDLSARAVNAIAKFVSMVENWRCGFEAEQTHEPQSSGGGESSQFEESLLGADAAPDASFKTIVESDSERNALADLVERIIRDSGMEDHYRKAKIEEERERLDNLEELISAATEFTPTNLAFDDDGVVEGDDEALEPAQPVSLQRMLTAYLESVALVSDSDAIDPESGAVTLMSLHAAKGLEYTVVAMAGLEEGLLPHSRAASSPSELEEERRLCFVGITRAKRHLTMCRAAIRTHRGLREYTVPSVFLKELPEQHVVRLDHAGEGDHDFVDDYQGDEFAAVPSYGKRPASSRQSAGRPTPPRSLDRGRRAEATVDFPVGSMVRHPKFGVGRVEAYTPRPSGSSARIVFQSVGTKTLILQYAKLEKV